MINKEDIIEAMCYVARHDYGLEIESKKDWIYSGMTREDRQNLNDDMRVLFNSCIEPYMEFK